MTVFLLAVAVFLIVVAIMSVGVMAGRKPIAGSCGGLKTLGVGATCEFCGGDPKKCESRKQASELDNAANPPTDGAPARPRYYDAARR